MRLVHPLLLGLWLLIVAHAAHSNDVLDPLCVDAAVVAKVVRQTPSESRDPSPIVMSSPWTLRLEVEQVVFGQISAMKLSVTAIMSKPFSHEIRHYLFLLKRDSQGEYAAAEITPWIVKDRNGKFVMPVDEPFADEWIVPSGWVPTDYERWLKPIVYRYEDAWWLDQAHPEWKTSSSKVVASPWTTQRDGKIYAARGLHMSDIGEVVTQRRALPCK